MKIVIIEGPDNTGKNTLIHDLLEKNEITKVIHCSTPKPCDDPLKAQTQYFVDLANECIFESKKTDVIVFNRYYQGEYVYGQIYRNEDPKKIMNVIGYLETKFRYELSNVDIYYVQLLSSDPEMLINMDDGKSLSKADKDKITREIELFKEVFDKSLISNKRIIYVNDGDHFRSREDILDEFNKFITNKI